MINIRTVNDSRFRQRLVGEGVRVSRQSYLTMGSQVVRQQAPQNVSLDTFKLRKHDRIW